MCAEEIIRRIEEIYPKVKDLVTLAGMDKGGWIVGALKEVEMGDHKHFIRCENCTFKECENIQKLKGEFLFLVKSWASHGVECSDFSPKPDANGIP